MRNMKKLLIITSICVSLFAAVFLSFGSSAAYAADLCPDGVTVVPQSGESACPQISADACTGGTFLGFPKWYKYLKSQPYTDELTGQHSCIPKVSGLTDIWRIVAAVIELLLRVGALVAVAFVLYGGITYTLSQANPDKTKQALKTIISALVGLVISIISTALVTFLAGRF